MIYISSSCVKHQKIKDSVLDLVNNGFTNIELSGGTEHYPELENDLLELKEKYGLNYLCHNYFPPPKKHFVLNLASLNNEIYEKSVEHLIKAVELSKKLGAEKFGFHAGFFKDIPTNQIGKKIEFSKTFDKDKALQRFCEGFELIKKEAGDLDLYIENNVFSHPNYQSFKGENIFMLTCSKEYFELKGSLDFNLLLDVAHLKVSCNTLGLDLKKELGELVNETDYFHISDNNALEDQNNIIEKDCGFINELRLISKKNTADFTLEMYDNIENIKKSYQMLLNL